MKACLFEDKYVEIDPRSLRAGGSWSAATGDPPVPDNHALLKLAYERLSRYRAPFMLDIGASTGSFPLLAAHIPEMTGWAVEPNNLDTPDMPSVFQLLRTNLEMNRLVDGTPARMAAAERNGFDMLRDWLTIPDHSQIRTLCLAVGAHTGNDVLKVPTPAESGLATLGSPVRFNQWTELPVTVVALDDCADLWGSKRIHFMKIDTEGAELLVLGGAGATIRAHKPDILVEVQPRNTAQFGYDARETVNLLTRWGFTGEQVSEEDWLFTWEG